MATKKAPVFIDLFAGCGGFTLGMQRAGFRCAAAVDFDSKAVSTLRSNLPEVEHVLERDLTKFSPKDLSRLLGVKSVDVIVGGPPCQGFSTARQVDGSNHGRVRLKADKRRLLYQEFLKFVEFFQPRVFVIENVLGIRSAAGGEYFTRVQHEARTLGKEKKLPGYRVHSQIEDAETLGVPQKRRRQLIVGVRADIRANFLPELECVSRGHPNTVLGTAIGDLPLVRHGSGAHVREYDLTRRRLHISRAGKKARDYLSNVLEIGRASELTGHIARPHSERDIRDFRRLREGESSAVAMRDRGVKFEFPYDKSSFKDRYTRQSRQRPCSTIVAHLSKDGLMFIHPTQDRSLTPREAARVQTFPDWFQFPEAQTHAFRQIGNAVPPLVAEAVGTAIRTFLNENVLSNTGSGRVDRSAAEKKNYNQNVFWLPAVRRTTAAAQVHHLATLSIGALRELPKLEFLTAWQTIFAVFPDLHPQSTTDHGDDKERCAKCASLFGRANQQNTMRYLRSGWPVALETAAKVAWQRVIKGEISKSEIFLISEPLVRERVRRRAAR